MTTGYALTRVDACVKAFRFDRCVMCRDGARAIDVLFVQWWRKANVLYLAALRVMPSNGRNAPCT
jgi:hypothetical protein